MEKPPNVEVLFRSGGSIAEVLERLIRAASASIDAALYRLNHPELFRALVEAAARGVRVRVILDRGKYDETPATQELFSSHRVPFRLLRGRSGPESKMHHKFAVFDGSVVTTGSYNWTLESEDLNFDNLVILRGSRPVKSYRREFEALWEKAEEPGEE